jgi:hypothetical protein
VIDRGA